MRTKNLLFILCAFLLIITSCNKTDDSVLEDTSQIEASGPMAANNGPISPLVFSSEDFFCQSNVPFAIEFENTQGQITFEYIVNTAYTPQIYPTSISWTIVDDGLIPYTSTISSIQTDFNFNTHYNVTVDITFNNDESLSSSFCVRRVASPIGTPIVNPVAICDSNSQLSGGCISQAAEASFTYIFP